MGFVYSEFTLSNPRDDALRPITVNALADTGALFLCIPQRVATQLQLEELEKKEVTVASGQVLTVPYVGPIIVRFDNRTGCTGAIVMGDEVLVGAIPMEEMDLVVRPSTREILVNPASPNIACGKVK